jgi:hypothetical protein
MSYMKWQIPQWFLFKGAGGKTGRTCQGASECMPAFPLSHACIVRDLTLIVTIDRRVRLTSPWLAWAIGMSVCPSPKGDGIGLISFLADGVLSLQRQASFQDGFSISPLGETGEGFVRWSQLGLLTIVIIKFPFFWSVPMWPHHFDFRLRPPLSAAPDCEDWSAWRLDLSPRPSQMGRGLCRLMMVLNFQVNDLFQEALASPPWGTCTQA